ncbi:MAG: glycosyltransferase [Betaproteobacteria bacterium]|nr:MAG: glycosyltransferase [Betaproteobacteria bacterium]
MVTYQPDLVLLERCLVSLATALDAARGEGILRDANVVLVDNTGSRTTAEAVVHLGESRFRGSGWTMNYLHRHTNIGYGRAHNLVMHGGNTHYHLVLNPDVELAPDALVAGMRFLDAHPEIGVLAPAVSGAHGEREFTCKRYPAVLDLALRAFAPAALRRWCRARLDRYEMRDAIEAVSGDGFVSPVPLLSGCFMLARRKPVDASGGFDPAYFLYFEDFDWSVRLNRITGSAYVPSVKIVHHGGGAARKGARHLAHFARSAVRFYRKHGWKWV